ncbi:uncharacterized protein N7458_011521 [Penicillium daleae]|uniref:MT-A70-domain-containing protein n=1 Tax=Penicillium daleae TaxID=63821 RepID=A0AAD6BT87_9EURO|nr:uncharacterized protein N7458_011521 [Penicillium daleae]KAJ5432365.1 hypothetical protein N7458_011521 [Penicillium daleae]
MTQSPIQGSAILYHNAENSIFLIDTPHSIALAQESVCPASSRNPDRRLSHAQDYLTLPRAKCSSRRRQLLSTPPLETPFPSTEPKSHAARAKVLDTIPLSEQRFHRNFIQPLVDSALQVLWDEIQSRGGQWCLPRCVHDDQPRRQMKTDAWPAGRQSDSGRKRRNGDMSEDGHLAKEVHGDEFSRLMPPVILSSTSVNCFESISDLNGSIVKNGSSERATLAVRSSSDAHAHVYTEYIIPPSAKFILCTLPLSQPETTLPGRILALNNPIPALPPTQKFDLLLFDPPWPNRSVRRSGHYQINAYSEMDLLTQRLRDILRVHSYQSGHSPVENSTPKPSLHQTRPQSRVSLAAIWITNAEKARRAAYDALLSAGHCIVEEWVWVKTTVDGRPISQVDGLWRKPYEILVIGRADRDRCSVDLGVIATTRTTATVTLDGRISTSQEDDLLGINPAGIRRRVIAAVPDLHSRKPNLKEVFERVFFTEGHETEGSNLDDSGARIQQYSAMEVFARNLTAGWWACGNEVLKFNARECWVDEGDS